MNEDDLIAILEGITGRLDRVEAQQQKVLDALAIIAETTLHTFVATDTNAPLPDEVIDAPIMAQAVDRNPWKVPVSRGTREEQERIASIINKGPAAIETELRAIKEQIKVAPLLSKRLRLAHRTFQLDQAMNRSFEQYQERNDLDRSR